MPNPWDNSQLNNSGLKSGVVYDFDTVRGVGHILGSDEDGPVEVQFHYSDKVKFYEVSSRSEFCCSADGFDFPRKREPKAQDRVAYFEEVIRSRSRAPGEEHRYAKSWTFYDELPLEDADKAG